MVEIGEIYRVVREPYPSVLILAAGYHADEDVVVAHLLSPDVEFASSNDLVLDETDTGLKYKLLLFSNLFEYISASRCTEKVGAVDENIIGMLSAIKNNEWFDREPAGPPIHDRDDPRWNFQLRELERLVAVRDARPKWAQY